jgi:hypothetical protein
MSDEKKFKVISGSISTLVMVLVLLILLFCGFKYQNPPPPAKKVIFVELTEFGGGSSGSGGNETPQNVTNVKPTAQDVVTQNVENNDVINTSKANTTKNNTAVVTPKPDPNAMFRPGTGGGTGGQNGTGNGPTSGNGFTSGRGGTGTQGIGDGTGTRGFAKIPDITIKEEGTVSVRVHVLADGTVLDAQIINSAKYPTSISSSVIQKECLRRAKEAKYRTGVEEFRYIIFSPGN